MGPGPGFAPSVHAPVAAATEAPPAQQQAAGPKLDPFGDPEHDAANPEDPREKHREDQSNPWAPASQMLGGTSVVPHHFLEV